MSTITEPTLIPALTETPDHRPTSGWPDCHHTLDDIIGYVVAYTKSEPVTLNVTFTDIAFIDNPNEYAEALTIKGDHLSKCYRKEVEQDWVVVHTVYKGGHRHG
jgi:hypothetical protein